MDRVFAWLSVLAALALLLIAWLPEGLVWLEAQAGSAALVPLLPLLDAAGAGLAPLRTAAAFPWALCFTVGLAAGSAVSLVLRGPHPRKRLGAEAITALAEEMAIMLRHLRTVSETCHASAYREADMVLLYADFQALQLSLQRLGLRVHWRHWEPGEDPTLAKALILKARRAGQ